MLDQMLGCVGAWYTARYGVRATDVQGDHLIWVCAPDIQVDI